MALKGRCKFLSTTQKTTPLTLALDSKNKELIDLVIKKTAKYTALDWHIFARIEDELPRLNELATPSLSILYKSAFQRSKQPDLIQFGVLKTKEGHPFSSFSYHIDCNNFIKQDLTTKETEEFLIYRVSSFQFNMTMGNLEGINFLSSLISCDDPEVFNAPIINTIIRTKWNQVRPLMFAQAAGYLLFLVSLVVYTLSSVSPGTDTAMLALIGILNVFFFIYEILQLSIGFKNYISDL